MGSASFSDPDGDPESGSTFRWLADGVATASGPTAEGLLLRFENGTAGANGESPLAAAGVGYAAGRFGQALALANPGGLIFARADNLPLTEGTWELWIAPRADGSDPTYADPNRWHVLLYYEAPDGDDLFIAQDDDSGVLYAGGTVDGQWQSAYSEAATTRAWKAGLWHHVAFTFSASGNFMRFYLDGVLVADTNEEHYWPPSAGGDRFAVGGTLWNTAAHYGLDEVRLSGRAADAAEIAARGAPDAATAPQRDLAAHGRPGAGHSTGLRVYPASERPGRHALHLGAAHLPRHPHHRPAAAQHLAPGRQHPAHARRGHAGADHLRLGRRRAASLRPDDPVRQRRGADGRWQMASGRWQYILITHHASRDPCGTHHAPRNTHYAIRKRPPPPTARPSPA